MGFAAAFSVALCLVYPNGYGREIGAAAREFGLDRELVRAVVAVESRYDASAVSPAGARGLMQLMPDTYRFAARHVDGLKDRDDPLSNLRAGCWYLSYLLGKFALPEALAAYNAGEGKVREWLDAGLSDYPYPETAAYVKKVSRAVRVYRYRI